MCFFSLNLSVRCNYMYTWVFPNPTFILSNTQKTSLHGMMTTRTTRGWALAVIGLYPTLAPRAWQRGFCQQPYLIFPTNPACLSIPQNVVHASPQTRLGNRINLLLRPMPNPQPRTCQSPHPNHPLLHDRSRSAQLCPPHGARVGATRRPILGRIRRRRIRE